MQIQVRSQLMLPSNIMNKKWDLCDFDHGIDAGIRRAGGTSGTAGFVKCHRTSYNSHYNSHRIV